MWKDIVGWKNYYEVNEKGDVRNKITEKVLVGDVNSGGYKRVCLYNKNNSPSKQRFFRHRLVAEYFVDNPLNLPVVNHKNGDKGFNHYKNLEWVSYRDNCVHSRKVIKRQEHKPFRVEFENGEEYTFDFKVDLSKKINVSSVLVKYWLHQKSHTYTKYGIKDIYYI